VAFQRTGMTSCRIRNEAMWESGLFAIGVIHFRRNFGVLAMTLLNLSGDLGNVDAGGTDLRLFDDSSFGDLVDMYRIPG